MKSLLRTGSGAHIKADDVMNDVGGPQGAKRGPPSLVRNGVFSLLVPIKVSCSVVQQTPSRFGLAQRRALA